MPDIRQITFKNRPAILVKSSVFEAVFLPMDGGKMASLRQNGEEWLAQASGTEYHVLIPEGDYVSSECSAFDDLFPTIDAYTPAQGAYAGITYPDHGEVCRYPLETFLNRDSVIFHFRSRLFPISMVKRVTVDKKGCIELEYTLHNDCDTPFAYIWAAHCMLAGRECGEVLTPYDAVAPIRMMFAPPDIPTLPRNRLLKRTLDGATYKFYYLERNTQGFCGYRDEATGRQLILRYSPDALPYLGIWLNNGAFKGMYNVALEPCSAPFDRPDAAAQVHCASVLPPRSRTTFNLHFGLE